MVEHIAKAVKGQAVKKVVKRVGVVGVPLWETKARCVIRAMSIKSVRSL